jgi:transcription-repair coupling factor (superfamily II helicase)
MVQGEAKAKRRPVLAAWSRGSRERLGNLLRENGVRAETAEDWKAARALPPDVVALVVMGIERGFIAEGIAVTAEQDLLGERIARPPRRRRRADQFIADATEIAEGDLVVHQDHGIGRYEGLVTIEVSGAPHDCLKLIYDGGDRLFVPVENIEILSRFGSEGTGVALDKLGGVSWQNRKAKAKSRIRDMAAELIRGRVLKVSQTLKLLAIPALVTPLHLVVQTPSHQSAELQLK